MARTSAIDNVSVQNKLGTAAHIERIIVACGRPRVSIRLQNMSVVEVDVWRLGLPWLSSKQAPEDVSGGHVRLGLPEILKSLILYNIFYECVTGYEKDQHWSRTRVYKTRAMENVSSRGGRVRLCLLWHRPSGQIYELRKKKSAVEWAGATVLTLASRKQADLGATKEVSSGDGRVSSGHGRMRLCSPGPGTLKRRTYGL
ncbi:hypothetical protein C8R47DRAFT_1163873 [Mycena vitilis]|nr:hypothetical protein C8R47DRAFT_1163873 [Mycena vitilis]